MSTVRVLIVDDERLSRQALRTYLERIPGVDIIGECADGPAALAAIREEDPDIVLLDIEMPGLSGFEVLDALESDASPVIVFVTAYDHALRAFEVEAADYVLKPFNEQRLTAAIERAVSRLRERSNHAASSDGQRHVRRLLIRQPAGAYFLDTSEIEWIEAVGNYVRIHTRRRTHMMRTPISELADKLDPCEFRRIHRSTIVNLACVKQVKLFGGYDYRVVLHDDTRLRVSRGFRDFLLQDVQ